ncbi:MAG: hypothetical protein MHM6MM_006232 [Cercozoa sp. M6MM]
MSVRDALQASEEDDWILIEDPFGVAEQRLSAAACHMLFEQSSLDQNDLLQLVLRTDGGLLPHTRRLLWRILMPETHEERTRRLLCEMDGLREEDFEDCADFGTICRDAPRAAIPLFLALGVEEDSAQSNSMSDIADASDLCARVRRVLLCLCVHWRACVYVQGMADMTALLLFMCGGDEVVTVQVLRSILCEKVVKDMDPATARTQASALLQDIELHDIVLGSALRRLGRRLLVLPDECPKPAQAQAQQVDPHEFFNTAPHDSGQQAESEVLVQLLLHWRATLLARSSLELGAVVALLDRVLCLDCPRQRHALLLLAAPRALIMARREALLLLGRPARGIKCLHGGIQVNVVGAAASARRAVSMLVRGSRVQPPDDDDQVDDRHREEESLPPTVSPAEFAAALRVVLEEDEISRHFPSKTRSSMFDDICRGVARAVGTPSLKDGSELTFDFCDVLPVSDL